MAKIVPYIAAALIAVASFVTGAVTDKGEALQIALDEDKAKAQCVELLDRE